MSAFIDELTAFERRLQHNLNDVYCPIHLCLGTESVSDALYQILKPQDWLFGYHRSHGHYKAKGGDMDALYREIMGEETGINGGFSGSQEFSDPAVNFHCSAIVGGLVGVATGCAQALKMNSSDAIAVCMLGDAGTEQGVFWESINFAALHKLPVAYICENNGMSVDAEIAERQARPILDRVRAFGLSTWSDVSGIRGCLNHARLHKPSFCEVKVKRDCAHINMATMREL